MAIERQKGNLFKGARCRPRGGREEGEVQRDFALCASGRARN